MKRYRLAAILLVGLAGRLAYVGFFPPEGARGNYIPDMDLYVSLGNSFANTWTLAEQGHPSARREPAYPILLGLTFKLFGSNYAAMALLHCVLGVLSVLLLYKIGSRLFGETIGLISAAILAAYPALIFYTAWSYRETFLVFVTMLGMYLLIEAHRRAETRLFAAAGVINAVAALTSTVFLGVGFALALPPIVLARRQWGRALRWSGAYLLAFFFLYSLWPLRNYAVFHTWVLGTTGASGDHFYMFQVAPEELGGTQELNDILARDPVWQEGNRLDPAQAQHFFWKAGIEKIRQAPLRYARLVAWRFFCDQWRFWPRPRNYYAHSFSALKLVSLFSDGWIIPLGFLGILLAGLAPGELLWIYLFIFSSTFIYSLILTMIRYRMPNMPWLILLASFTLHEGWKRLRAYVAGSNASIRESITK